jgi:hypothetical protein
MQWPYAGESPAPQGLHNAMRLCGSGDSPAINPEGAQRIPGYFAIGCIERDARIASTIRLMLIQ